MVERTRTSCILNMTVETVQATDRSDGWEQVLRKAGMVARLEDLRRLEGLHCSSCNRPLLDEVERRFKELETLSRDRIGKKRVELERLRLIADRAKKLAAPTASEEERSMGQLQREVFIMLGHSGKHQHFQPKACALPQGAVVLEQAMVLTIEQMIGNGQEGVELLWQSVKALKWSGADRCREAIDNAFERSYIFKTFMVEELAEMLSYSRFIECPAETQVSLRDFAVLSCPVGARLCVGDARVCLCAAARSNHRFQTFTPGECADLSGGGGRRDDVLRVGRRGRHV